MLTESPGTGCLMVDRVPAELNACGHHGKHDTSGRPKTSFIFSPSPISCCFIFINILYIVCVTFGSSVFGQPHQLKAAAQWCLKQEAPSFKGAARKRWVVHSFWNGLLPDFNKKFWREEPFMN